MTKILWVIAASLLAAAPASAADEYADELRGVAFGARADSVKDLKPAGQPQGSLQLFKRESDALKYRGIALTEILYGFDGGKLVFVEMWGKEVGPAYELDCRDLAQGSGKQLNDALSKRFGAAVDRADTLLDGMNGGLDPFEDVLGVCPEDADCAFDRYHVPPAAKPPEARTFVATAGVITWTRERDLKEFSAKELEAARKDPASVKMDEFRCRAFVRFSQGESRADLDRRKAAHDKLLDAMKGADKAPTPAPATKKP